MANYRIELNKRLEAAFYDAKYIASSPLLKRRKKVAQNNPYENSQDLKVLNSVLTEPDYRGSFKLPMFDQVEVKSTESSLLYKFEYDPLVDISYSKSITETKTSSGRMVVEYAGINPASINIRGVLWNSKGGYPNEALEKLLAVFQEEAVLEVSSRLFNFHKIANIYIKSLSTPALEGFEDTQPFTIQARSIEPVSLIITENELQ